MFLWVRWLVKRTGSLLLTVQLLVGKSVPPERFSTYCLVQFDAIDCTFVFVVCCVVVSFSFSDGRLVLLSGKISSPKLPNFTQRSSETFFFLLFLLLLLCLLYYWKGYIIDHFQFVGPSCDLYFVFHLLSLCKWDKIKYENTSGQASCLSVCLSTKECYGDWPEVLISAQEWERKYFERRTFSMSRTACGFNRNRGNQRCHILSFLF